MVKIARIIIKEPIMLTLVIPFITSDAIVYDSVGKYPTLRNPYMIHRAIATRKKMNAPKSITTPDRVRRILRNLFLLFLSYLVVSSAAITVTSNTMLARTRTHIYAPDSHINRVLCIYGIMFLIMMVVVTVSPK